MSSEGDGERRRTEQELRLLYRAVAASSNGITISDSNLPDDSSSTSIAASNL
jgi:hypothetical protein